MMTYLVLLLVVISFAFMAETYPRRSFGNTALFGAAFVAMVLVPAVRDVSVGTDTENYVQFFEAITDLPSALAMGIIDNEYGFWAVNWLAHLISDRYASLLLAVALIVVGCYLYAILRDSCNAKISIFVFMTAGFYTFFFNGARQAIACAICALAIRYLMERDIKRYLKLVVVAVLFHKTAIIMLPVYFVIGASISFKRVMLYALVGTIAALSLEAVVQFGATIDPRYADYAVSGEGGGFLIVAFTVLLCIFFFVFRDNVKIYRNQYLVLLNMLICGALISCISSIFRIAPSGILRLSIYFNVATLFLWPIVFANLKQSLVRQIGLYFFGIVYIVFFLLSVDRFGDLSPFTINPAMSLDLF